MWSAAITARRGTYECSVRGTREIRGDEMTYRLDAQSELKLRLGEDIVRVFYRRPEPGETIEALVRKIPRGDEGEDALRILMANLELGKVCIIGIGEEDMAVNGTGLETRPEAPGYREDWKEVLAQRCPLILIALGQHLSTLPAFVTEAGLKKS